MQMSAHGVLVHLEYDSNLCRTELLSRSKGEHFTFNRGERVHCIGDLRGQSRVGDGWVHEHVVELRTEYLGEA